MPVKPWPCAQQILTMYLIGLWACGIVSQIRLSRPSPQHNCCTPFVFDQGLLPRSSVGEVLVGTGFKLLNFDMYKLDCFEFRPGVCHVAIQSSLGGPGPVSHRRSPLLVPELMASAYPSPYPHQIPRPYTALFWYHWIGWTSRGPIMDPKSC